MIHGENFTLTCVLKLKNFLKQSKYYIHLKLNDKIFSKVFNV